MSELETLFAWAVTQSGAAASIPPYAIHTAQYARGHTAPPIKSGQIIRSRPFTVAFEKYISGEDDIAPIVLALMDIHSDPTLWLEYEIAWAIVCGRHDDLDVLYAVMGRPQGFDAAARRALTLLRDKTTQTVQRQVAETSERVQRAGEAAKAREEDKPTKPKRKDRRDLLIGAGISIEKQLIQGRVVTEDRHKREADGIS